MSDGTARPLLACECIECPSHEGEREHLMSEVATLEAEVARLRATLTRLIDTYDALFANDPRGNAVEFESALAMARAATPRCDATQTGVRCDLTAGHPGPHGGPDRARGDLLTSRLYWE